MNVNYLSKHLFVVLLAAGVVLSWMVRIFFESTLGTEGTSITAIVICLVFLVMYAYTVWRDNTGLHNPENLYYMGFLFTLAALVYSLVTLFWLTGNDSDIVQRTYNLIGSFGIALISTFAGILGRILLLQKQDFGNLSPLEKLGSGDDFDQPPSSSRISILQKLGLGNLSPLEKQGSGDGFDQPPSSTRNQNKMGQQRLSVHVDLADAAFKLRRELTQTIADMGVFRGAIVQATHETVNEASKACAALTQRVEETANEQTRILSMLATSTVDKLAITLDGVTASVENVQKSLDDLVDKQVERTQQSIQESDEVRTAMIQQIKEAANEQTRILSMLATSTVDKLAITLDGVTASVENVQKSLDDLVDKQVERTQQSIQESNEVRTAMIQQIKEAANEQTSILSRLATTTVDSVTASVENVQKSLDDLADKQVKRAQQSIDLAEKSTRELENGMQNSLRQIGQSTAEIKTAFDATLVPLQGIVGNLQSTSDDTQDIFNRYSSLNSALQESLAFFTNIENKIAQTATALTVSTEAFSGSLSKAAEVTPQYTQQFEQLIMTLRQEAEQWQSMTQEVRSSLVQAIDELTQLVKRS